MSDDIPYWLERAEHSEIKEVVVIDRFDQVFHDKEELGTLWDMYEEDIESAAKDGIKPCSKCFPRLNSRMETDQMKEIKELR